jgi:hypothetical protein
MPFSGDSVAVQTSDGRTFRLLEPLVYSSPQHGSTTTVPAGFESDGASTPSSVWSIVPPFGQYFRAAVLHDWLYRETYLPREYCDSLFCEAMAELGVSALMRETIHAAVRLGGAAPFYHDRALLDARSE